MCVQTSKEEVIAKALRREKRLEIATHIAQGIVIGRNAISYTEVAEQSFKMADALLKEHEKNG